eukprot:2557451-Rhodomonas_salina.1
MRRRARAAQARIAYAHASLRSGLPNGFSPPPLAAAGPRGGGRRRRRRRRARTKEAGRRDWMAMPA